MGLARLSTKGQIVLPKEVRERYGLHPGAELTVEEHADHIVLRPVRRVGVDDLLGLLAWDGPPKSLEEMEQGIARGVRERS